ncbi:MAG: M48 family metalloprotease [Prevotella sp.]|nr:M48 family metalloprotease [Prevotellaceae bacterium]MDY3935651.1 M48 family metalloprotease [Prevotella sp.]
MNNRSFVKHILKTFIGAVMMGIILTLLRNYNQEGMILIITASSVFFIFFLNVIIDRKQKNTLIPEQYFKNIEEKKLPKSVRGYLLIESITAKILYYNSNEVNSHLIQKRHYNYIILTSAALQQMNTAETAALIFHEIGHIKGNHAKKKRIYCNLRNTAYVAFIGLCSCFSITLSLSLLETIIFFFINIELFIWGGHLLLCWLLRNQEYEADKFAVIHCKRESLVSALDKTNKCFTKSIYSSHPNVLQRINRIHSYA